MIETLTVPSFAVGYCHGGGVRGGFLRSIVRFGQSPIAHFCEEVIEAAGLYIHVNHNNVVRQFLKGSAEWLLVLDTDMVFTPEDIASLFHARFATGGRILAGLYDTFIGGVRMPCWFSSLNPPTVAIPGTEPMPLASCGMGFTVIHREVLEAMQSDDPSPWFAHDNTETLVGASPIGDDATFCQRASFYGFVTWGIPSVKLGHEKTRIVYPADEEF